MSEPGPTTSPGGRGLRARLAGTEFLVGTWVTLSDPAVVEIARDSTLDFLIVDAEHSPFGPETVDRLVAAGRGSAVHTLVRVPAGAMSLLAQALDAGAAGVVIPQVRSADDVRSAVSAARYPPEGSRGWGPRRPTDYGRRGSPYRDTVNDDTVVIPMIELSEAVAALEEIVRVPGVDAVLIGPNDLAGSLGHLGRLDHPDVVAVIDRILDVSIAAGMPVGIACAGTESEIARWHSCGCRFVAAAADYMLLAEAFDSLGAIRPSAHP